MKHCIAGFLLLTAVVSCDLVPEKTTYTLAVEATKCESAATKSLSPDTNEDGRYILNASWKTTDVVYVRRDGVALGSLSPQSAGTSAVLKGELNGLLHTGDRLSFSWPDDGSETYGDYTGQDGTLETIEGRYDYIAAEAAIQTIDHSEIGIDPLSFKPRQAIVKFVLLDADNQPIYPTRLTLDALSGGSQLYTSGGDKGGLEVNIDQSTPTNEVFVALKQAGEASSFTVKADFGRLGYSFEKTTPTLFEDGRYQEIAVKFGTPALSGDLSVDDIAFDFNFSTEYSGRSSLGYIFFEGVTTGYYRVYLNGGKWTSQKFVTLDGKSVNPVDLLTNRRLTAVLLPQLSGEDKPVFEDGKWTWGKGFEGLEYYFASNVQYDYSEIDGKPALSADIVFKAPDNPGISVLVETPDLDANSVVKVACNNLIPTGLVSVSSEGGIEVLSKNRGDWMDEVNGLVHGRLAASPESVYYYALDADLNGKHSYYHFFQTRSSALADGDKTAESASVWKQVGPGHYVTVAGRTFWTTNLAADRYSPEPTPWVTADLTWTTENQWNAQRYKYSLSEATFADNSELPDGFNWKVLHFYYVTACGTKGIILADLADQSNFIFLPLRTTDDFLFYAIIRKPDSEHYDPQDRFSYFSWHYNWHYWAKDYLPGLSTHEPRDNGTAKEHWMFNWTSTLCFTDSSDLHYSYYLAGSSWGGIPDYAIMSEDNQPLYFPARPVKK